MNPIAVLKQLSGTEEHHWQIKGIYYDVWFFRSLNKNFWETLEGKIIFEQLYILTQLGFAQKDSPTLRENTEDHILDGEFLCVVGRDDQIVCYAVLDLWEKETQQQKFNFCVVWSFRSR